MNVSITPKYSNVFDPFFPLVQKLPLHYNLPDWSLLMVPGFCFNPGSLILLNVRTDSSCNVWENPQLVSENPPKDGAPLRWHPRESGASCLKCGKFFLSKGAPFKLTSKKANQHFQRQSTERHLKANGRVITFRNGDTSRHYRTGGKFLNAVACLPHYSRCPEALEAQRRGFSQPLP